MFRTTFLSALVLVLAAGCAESEPAKPMPPVAKVPLADAVGLAQQHSQGRAIRAEYEQQKDGKWVYDVEVAKGVAAIEVRIDATTGAVLATRDAARDDEEQDED